MNVDTALATIPPGVSPPQLAGEQLEAAFNMFNQLSRQLSHSYEELEKQVAQLSGELAEARHQRLQQLVEKERLAHRLEALLNTLPAGVVVLDEAGCINQFNQNAAQMLATDLMGQCWSAMAQQFFIRDADGLRLSDGRWVSISMRPLVAEPNTGKAQSAMPAGQIILITEVTEIHQL